MSGVTNVFDLEAHHKININTPEGWQNRFNIDDLVTLDRSCHQKETVREQAERKDQERQKTIDDNMNKLNNGYTISLV